MILYLWDFCGPCDKDRKDEGGDSCGERNEEVFPSQCFLSNQNLTLEGVLILQEFSFRIAVHVAKTHYGVYVCKQDEKALFRSCIT